MNSEGLRLCAKVESLREAERVPNLCEPGTEQGILNARLKKRLSSAMEGKTVLVTGASSGIGRASAKMLAEAGAQVLLVARHQDALEKVAAEIQEQGGSAFCWVCDISDLDDCDRLAREVLAEHGHIDVLFNNAGHSIRRAVAHQFDRFHDFQRTMQINYFGALRLTLNFLPSMQERGGGHIVYSSTMTALTGAPRFAGYIASKTAMDAFIRSAAPEFLGDGIVFTTVHFPLVRTPMIAPTESYEGARAITPEQAAQMVARALITRKTRVVTMLGRFGILVYALVPGIGRRILKLGYHRLW